MSTRLLLILRLQRGQALIEYVVLLALGVVVIVVILHLTGSQVHNVFSNISRVLAGPGSSPTPAPSPN